jgi:hypothetical protein
MLRFALFCMIMPLVAATLPDPKLTPGATMTVTLAHLCQVGYTDTVRNVPESLKRKVFEEYGITSGFDHFEIDHLQNLGIAGSNDIKNLWPQPYCKNGWCAREKDALENRLRKLACSHEIALHTAQEEIAANWIEAYKKVFHTKRPSVRVIVRK